MVNFIYYVQFAVLPVLLFVIVNWIGAHSLSYGYISMGIFVQRDSSPAYNLLFRAVSPVIFIILVCSIYYYFNLDFLVHNIWYVSPIYFAIRILYNISLSRWQLVNKWREIFILLISSALSLVIYNKFISVKTNLLPDPENLVGELWIIIILYIYNTFDKIQINSSKAEKRREDYYEKYYTMFKIKFGTQISAIQPTPILESLIYSVMIYENFNRPALFRFFERVTFPLFSKTLGIMQVKASKKITDRESVAIGSRILQTKYDSEIPIALAEFKNQGIENAPVDLVLNATFRPIRETLKNYNKDDDYISGVMQLQGEIIKKFYPGIKIIW